MAPHRFFAAAFILAHLLATQVCLAQANNSAKPSTNLSIPDGWLAIATLPDLEAADGLMQSALGDLGYQLVSVRSLLQQVLGKEMLAGANNHLSFGLAADTAQLGDDLLPFAIWHLPQETRFEEFVTRLGGEVFGDRALLTIAGIELIAAPRGLDVLIVDARRQDYLAHAWIQDKQSISISSQQSSLPTLHTSKAGLQRLTNELEVRRDGTNAIRESPHVWQKDIEGMLNKAAQHTSLVKEFAESFNLLSISIRQANADYQVSINATLVETDSFQRGTSQQNGADAAGPAFKADAKQLTDRSPIALVHLNDASLSPRWLAPFELAYERGTLTEAGIKKPDVASLKAYEESLLSMAKQVSHLSGVLLSVEKDQPVVTNRLAIYSVDDANAFIETARESFAKWNALVAASETDMKFTLQFENTTVSASESSGAGKTDYSAVLCHADMVEVVDVDITPEIRKLMDQFYGNEGVFKQHYVVLDPQTVLISDLPLDEIKEACIRWGHATPKSQKAACVFYLDRYLAWKEQVTRISLGDVIGRRPPVAMEESAPLQASGRVGGDYVELELTLPQATLKAVGKLLK